MVDGSSAGDGMVESRQGHIRQTDKSSNAGRFVGLPGVTPLRCVRSQQEVECCPACRLNTSRQIAFKQGEKRHQSRRLIFEATRLPPHLSARCQWPFPCIKMHHDKHYISSTDKSALASSLVGALRGILIVTLVPCSGDDSIVIAPPSMPVTML